MAGEPKTQPLHHDANNFDLLRLAAAVFVLLSHSFMFYRQGWGDPLAALNGNFSLASLALASFFTISGYFVTASYAHRRNVKVFLLNRVLRIFPALIVVMLLTTLILGPLLTTLPLHDYFADRATWKFFRGVLILPLTYVLPGVFEHNPGGSAVNGSLWSLELEIKCYLVIALLGVTRLLKPRVLLYFTAAVLVIYLAAETTHYPPRRFLGMKFMDILHYSQWMYYFFAGATFFLIRPWITLDGRIALALVALNLALIVSPFSDLAFRLSFPYIIFYLGFAAKSYGRLLRGQDISYGFYIYAFPIQQSYMYWIGGRFGFAGFILICAATVTLFAWLSWVLIERPAMGLKRRFG